jgi:hypothetical protein
MRGAETGVDPAILARFDAKLAEWYASRDKIVNTLAPNLQRAIDDLYSWQRLLQQLVEIAHASLPLLGISTGPQEDRIQGLGQAVNNVAALGQQVQTALNQIPSVVRMVNTLTQK